MAQWVISVAGIAILSVLADSILPNGQTRKYIKTVIGIVVTLVVVQPVFSLLNIGNGLTASERVDYAPQQAYVEYVAAERQQALALRSELLKEGFAFPTVTADANCNTLTVNFTERFSTELQKRAQAAVERSGTGFAVSFVWNG